MTVCNYYDCGWCYAPDNVKTNAVQGTCVAPINCPYLKSQMTDIQQLKEDIAILQMKLKVLEEAEKQQPKTLFDAIRNLGYSVDACYEIIDAVEDFYETVDDGELQPEGNEWKSVALRFGEKLSDTGPDGYYNFSPEEWFEWAFNECFAIKPETSQERGERIHKEMEQSLKESFKEAQQTEKWKQTQKLIDEVDNNKNFKNSLDLIKEWGEQNKPLTLYDLIFDWWADVFTTGCDTDDTETCIDNLVDEISLWLPTEHETNSYKWNECIRMIRGKLR